MRDTPPAGSAPTPLVPPARPEPAPYTPLIRPILIVKPTVERIEHHHTERYREYGEGYQPLRSENERQTEPIVIPPTPAPIVNVHVLPPMQQERSPEVEYGIPSRPEEIRSRREERDRRTPPPDKTYPEIRPVPPTRADPTPPVVDDRPAAQSEPVPAGRTIVPEPDIRTPETPTPDKNSSPVGTKTVRPPNKNSSDEPIKTIPNNSGNNSPTELFEPDKSAPQADAEDFRKVGKPAGRQRRYDELGLEEIEPIRELFLVRHLTGKHWPGLSKDMEAYYEKFYFTRPKKGSKDYAKHVKCWERRTRWIAALTSDSATA